MIRALLPAALVMLPAAAQTPPPHRWVPSFFSRDLVGWQTWLPFDEPYHATRTIAVNHEAQCYEDAAAQAVPAVANITASPSIVLTATRTPNSCGLPVTSGAITTYGSFSQLYGYFEAYAVVPQGAELWPAALWLLSADNSGDCEIDVMERFGPDAGNYAATVLSHLENIAVQHKAPVDFTQGHAYGVDWEPDAITFFLDGKLVASVPTPGKCRAPMYLLSDLAVAGPGSWQAAQLAAMTPPPPATRYPASMIVEYVAAWRSAVAP